MKTPPTAPAGLATTLLIGSLGLLVLGLEPVLLGALVVEGRITEHAVGALVTVELVTIALGSMLGMTLLARYRAPAAPPRRASRWRSSTWSRSAKWACPSSWPCAASRAWPRAY